MNTTPGSPTPRTPASCCASGSGYQNLRCDNYFHKGCLGKMYELTLQVVLMLDTVALGIAVVQVRYTLVVNVASYFHIVFRSWGLLVHLLSLN